MLLLALVCKAPDPADTRAGSSAPPVRAAQPKGLSSRRAVLHTSENLSMFCLIFCKN